MKLRYKLNKFIRAPFKSAVRACFWIRDRAGKDYIRSGRKVKAGKENCYYVGGLSVKGKVRFGNYCAIGENLRDNYHLPALQSKFYSKHFKGGYPGGGKSKEVEIKNDVWIGDNVIILAGVTVGNGACIGAGAVVTKDVPPYAIVGGNPARVIKYRFEPEVIKFLEDVKWWEWSDDRIKKNKEFFYYDFSTTSLEKIKETIQ